MYQAPYPVEPNPDAVPEFDIVTPEGIVNVSPLSPNVVVPQFVLGLILFTFISLIIIDIYTLLLQLLNPHFLKLAKV